ncbi:rhoGEF domain-containing protein [Naegleria gruberi]|uniref:RhoGEF domain-containing protein n=1 Tax=Naegleria gruberi TaxID=5762 RepID=D2V5E8_NAEGR|nr:rhoGEF domain-containing protein [Naegleria gruberi]EFC48101.1 rhoGEF domain-containing protein [Naegleria gruberi]|eukprot:XP_002680845.1 rhoGEF domain-containing protein [Naegleria gruberi strain NEG-M]
MLLLEVLFYVLVLIVTGVLMYYKQASETSSTNNQQADNNLFDEQEAEVVKKEMPVKMSTDNLIKEDLSSPAKKHSREDSLTVKSNESIFDEIMNTTINDDEMVDDIKMVIEKSPIEKKRDRILEEILTTEESYVKGLRTLEENYLKPIKEILQKETFDLIFNDIAIIKGVNENFLQELKKIYFGVDGLSCLAVAKLMLHYAHSFKLYTRFIGNYGIAVSTLEEEKKKNGKLRKMLDKIAEKLSDEATVSSDFTIDGHLVLPLQRIPRYQLLLQQLKEFTDHNDESFVLIENALSLIKEIASELNNRQLEYSNIHKSLELGETFKLKDFFIPTRRLLYYFEGDNEVNYKRSNGKTGILDLYVFTDLLLLNRRSGFLSKQEFIFAPHSKDDNSSTDTLELEEDTLNQTLILTCTFKPGTKTEPRVLEMYFEKNPDQYNKVKQAIEAMMENQTSRKSVSSRSSI